MNRIMNVFTQQVDAVTGIDHLVLVGVKVADDALHRAPAGAERVLVGDATTPRSVTVAITDGALAAARI